MTIDTVPRTQAKDNSKSRIELTYLAGEPTRPWVGIRYRNDERGGEIVTGLHAEPMDAANDMLTVRLPGETVRILPYLKDQLITGWYIEGVEMYRAGMSRNLCRISHVARGFDAAWQDDVQPVVFRRHPELKGAQR